MTDIERKIKEYFEGIYDVLAVYIFGSLAKGKLNRFSDIDIAILLEKNIEGLLNTNLRLKYMLDLSSLLKKETEVIILNSATPFLKYQIFKYGRPVIERDIKKSRFFKAKSLLEYFDFKPMKDFLEMAVIKKLKESVHG